jgi:hypothetical protein
MFIIISAVFGLKVMTVFAANKVLLAPLLPGSTWNLKNAADLPRIQGRLSQIGVTVGNSPYTIGSLLKYIRTNNANANFAVTTDKGGKSLASGGAVAGKVYISAGGNKPQDFPSELRQLVTDENSTQVVSIQVDNALIEYLTAKKHLYTQSFTAKVSATKTRKFEAIKDLYSKILLYFEVSFGGKMYRFYLVDPWPGIVKRTSKSTTVPAKSFIESWFGNVVVK